MNEAFQGIQHLRNTALKVRQLGRRAGKVADSCEPLQITRSGERRVICIPAVAPPNRLRMGGSRSADRSFKGYGPAGPATIGRAASTDRLVPVLHPCGMI
jgi:hypothetical protein